jgi:hypothetical protein
MNKKHTHKQKTLKNKHTSKQTINTIHIQTNKQQTRHIFLVFIFIRKLHLLFIIHHTTNTQINSHTKTNKQRNTHTTQLFFRSLYFYPKIILAYHHPSQEKKDLTYLNHLKLFSNEGQLGSILFSMFNGNENFSGKIVIIINK